MSMFCGNIVNENSTPINGLYLVDTRICDHEVGATNQLTYRQYITAVNYATFNNELIEFQTAMNSWGWDTIEEWVREADMFMNDITSVECDKLTSYLNSKGWSW